MVHCGFALTRSGRLRRPARAAVISGIRGVFDLLELVRYGHLDRVEVLQERAIVSYSASAENPSSPTFGLIPRSTVFRSCSSISFALIFFTTAMSAVSATYLRFSGLEVVSAPFENDDVDGREVVVRDCGGVPGGVVDSAINRAICQFTGAYTHIWQAQSELKGGQPALSPHSAPEQACRSA